MRRCRYAMKHVALVLLPLSVCLSAVHPAEAATITLHNGDVLHAAVTAQSEDSVTIEHPTLGTLKLPRSSVRSIEDNIATAADPLPTPVAAPAVNARDNGLLGIGLLEGWERKLELGVNGADGKNNYKKFRAGFEGDYKDKEKRWALDALYIYDEADDTTTEKEFYAELTRDWLHPGSPWFNFANARYDWDKFKDWDHRANAFGGVGYQFLDNQTWSLAGRLGLGATRTFGGDREEFTPESLVGIDGHWQIANAQRLKFRSSFYPNLEEWGEFRNISGVDWEMRMATEINLSLKLGIANEYDSLAEDVEKNDFKYYGGLVWGF